ncbi:MAG: hypothetical protein GX444_19445 [Myxococcales bacterium]|nr:hypothetical protein [Myxococcales bacterium]
MRCPRCNFVSFDDLDHCKKCGFDLVAFREGKPEAKPSWFDRLRSRREAPSEGAARDSFRYAGADEKAAEPGVAGQNFPDLIARERQLREEISRLQREYNHAPEEKAAGLGRRLDALKREKLALARRIEKAEADRREVRDWKEPLAAAASVKPRPAEVAVPVEKHDRPERSASAFAASPPRPAPPAEKTVDLAPILEAQKKIQHELAEAQRAKEQIRRELEEARKERERLAEEMRRAQEDKYREDAEAKANLLRLQQEEVVRLQEERRLLSEAAEKMQEERDRLSRERETVEREKQKAAEARQHALELIEQAKQAQPKPELEPEPIVAPVAESPATAETPLPTLNFHTIAAEPRAEESAEPAPRSMARAEDVLAHLAQPRSREKPKVESTEWTPPALAAPPRQAAEEVAFAELPEEPGALAEPDEFPEEEEEDADEATGAEVIPKGGLVYRGLAALIDFLLLLLVLGLFLVIGRLVSGSKGGDAAEVVRMLGLPFYILFLFLSAAYFTYLHGTSGQTLGKRLMRLQVFTTHGEPIGYLTAFFRFVAACFALAFFGMGIFWIALDPNKQGWHDKLSRTVVIRL